MLTSNYKRIYTVICLFWTFSMIESNGVFQLKLVRFVNDEGRDQAGQCCVNPESTRCSAPCRTAFRICLTHYQSTVSGSSSCTYGKVKTPVLGENTFNPAANRFFQFKPIEFNFSFRWPRSFSLVIDVLHEPGNATSEDHGRTGCLVPVSRLLLAQCSSETIISRLVKSTEALPVKGDLDLWIKPDPYVHRKSKLYYEYRILCGDNQYGNDCGTFCRPRNDNFGHYTCSESGERTCLPGWTKSSSSSSSSSDYCTKALCPKGCDQSRGSCEEPNVCRCHVGWRGDDCSQCKTIPNCAHGTCKKPFQCTCLPGWGGSFCNQDLNYCINNRPCRNGATCTNTGEGSYVCACRPGFIGKNCQLEVNECDSNPCQNNAECVDMKDDYKCVCAANFFGRNCERNEANCADGPCANGGTCTNKGDSYQCTCPRQWKGVNCERPANNCPDKPCLNNGTCRESASGFECSCKAGFTGAHCETRLSRCGDMLCLNGGSCVDFPAGEASCFCRRCLCPSQFTGNRCERHLVAAGSTANGDEPGVVVLKSTFKSERYEVNHTETKIVNLGAGADKSLSAPQWIWICLGATAIVLLLVILTCCLLYRKRKTDLAKSKQNFSQPLPKQDADSRNSDLTVSAEHSCLQPVIIRERSPINPEVRLSTTSFQTQRSLKRASLADVDHYIRTERRSSGKSSIAASEGRCCRPYSSHFVYSFPDDEEAAAEAIPLRRPSSLSSPPRCAIPYKVAPTKRNGAHERPKSLRHSLTRPPTYEEVCREKGELVRLGLQTTNGIAI